MDRDRYKAREQQWQHTSADDTNDTLYVVAHNKNRIGERRLCSEEKTKYLFVTHHIAKSTLPVTATTLTPCHNRVNPVLPPLFIPHTQRDIPRPDHNNNNNRQK